MPGPSSIVLLRHAEPQAAGGDPGLSAAGRKRADLLSFMLQDADVTAIFTSELRRTKETAQPLATHLSLVPAVLAGLDAAAHRDRVLSVPAGIVVVVGHTNTVPQLIAALRAGNVQIGPSEFDRMFIVSRLSATTAGLVSMRYRL